MINIDKQIDLIRMMEELFIYTVSFDDWLNPRDIIFQGNVGDLFNHFHDHYSAHIPRPQFLHCKCQLCDLKLWLCVHGPTDIDRFISSTEKHLFVMEEMRIDSLYFNGGHDSISNANSTKI